VGEAALKSHLKGTQHLHQLSQLKDVTINPTVDVFFGRTASDDATASQPCTTAVQACTSAIATNVNQFVANHSVTSAEILWALKVTVSHYSHHSVAV